MKDPFNIYKCRKCGKEISEYNYIFHDEMDIDCYYKKESRVNKIIIICSIVAVLLFTLIFMIGFNYERQVFNKINHTSYSFSEWIFARNIILDYHEGKVSNVNLNIQEKEE